MAEEIKVIYLKSQKDWQAWLKNNHASSQSVWLIFYKKISAEESMSWSEAVDVALCFGWIDSKKKNIDECSYRQFYCKRKPLSTWSKINKLKIKDLMKQGLMTSEGIKSIEVAKQNGSWSILDEVEELIVPKDLESQFSKNTDLKLFYEGLSRTYKKRILSSLVLLKKSISRKNKIEKILQSLKDEILGSN